MDLFASIKIAFVALAFTSLVNCNNNHGEKVHQVVAEQKGKPVEGFIHLSAQVYEDIDDAGHPVRPLQADGKEFFGTSRQMYIHDSLLIDVSLHKRFQDGKYRGTDTVGYIFYDLQRQQSITFSQLSATATVLKKAVMEKDGSFSSDADVDPMNGISDSLLKFTDTVINQHRIKLAHFAAEDSENRDYARRARFWIDTETRDFPLQISYLLSKRTNNSFVYKMQLPMPDGKAVMVTEFRYEPAMLPDTVRAVFNQWRARLINFK